MVYHSVQSFGDKGGAGAASAVPYAEASGGRVPDASGEKGVSGFKFNKVENVSGSNAGAGSGEFHIYRAMRRRENFRLEEMAKEHTARLEDLAHRAAVGSATEEVTSRAAKRVEKRKRKEASRRRAKAARRSGAAGDESGGGEEAAAGEEEEEEEEEDAAAVASAVAEALADAPDIPFANDGSFLEKALAAAAAEAPAAAAAAAPAVCGAGEASSGSPARAVAAPAT